MERQASRVTQSRELTENMCEAGRNKDTEFALGKASLKENSSATGVIPSLAIIRRHINDLNTEVRGEFAFNLGAVLQFVDLNFLRSAIMLGQNLKLIDWLFRWVDQVEFQVPIMKIVGLIAATVKFSLGCEVRIRELFLAKAISFIKKQPGQKKYLRKLTLPKLGIECDNENSSPQKAKEPEVTFPEYIDEKIALLVYSLLVIEKNRDTMAPEVASELSLPIVSSLELVGPTFGKLRKSELRTLINDKINCVLKWVAPLVPELAAVLKLGDLIALSLIFQQKTDFVYTLQAYLLQLVQANLGKSSMVLMDLVNNQVELRTKVLANCTKLRSVLFVSRVLAEADPALARQFFNLGGRELYIEMLRSHLEKDKMPNIYIFLEDQDLLRSMTAEQEDIISEVSNRITNGAVRYQLVDKMSNFNKALYNMKALRRAYRPEFTNISKVFKAKETAEIVMNGIVSNFWKENSLQSNNLVIEVKNKRKRRSVEIEMSSPGHASVKSDRSAYKSTKSGSSFLFHDTMDEEPIVEGRQHFSPNKQPRDSTSAKASQADLGLVMRPKKKANLYSYDSQRELSTKDISDLVDSFYQYNSKSKRIEIYHNKETRLVYHRRIHSDKGLFFGVLEIDNQVDLILLNAIVYSPHRRKIFVNSTIKTMERVNHEGRPFYEKDFVTLCSTTTESGSTDHLIVVLDKCEGINKLLYKPLQGRDEISEVPAFEQIFISHGAQFDSMRSFTLSSGLNTVLVGCKHLLSVFEAKHNTLTFKTVVSDIGFTISRIRLLDRVTNTYLLLGYAAREFNIMNLSHKKMYNFVFEWLQSNQTITEVEIDDNIMIYLIEDSKRKHSSVYIRDKDGDASDHTNEHD